MYTIEGFQKYAHRVAVEHGWWPKRLVASDVQDDYPGKPLHHVSETDEPNIPEKIALMHSELSEALEHYRNVGLEDFNSGGVFNKEKNDFDMKPDGFWIELADCIIRIFDLAGYYNIDMEKRLVEKMKYNETRPYRHGGKKA